MQRFYDVVTDQFGNPANGVLVSVYNASTGLPATIYRDSDNALTATNVISNPFTTNASGIAAFAAANGQYTITYSGSSITPRTFTWLTLNDGSTSSVPWGSITGTLSDQTDLDTALGLKAPSASPTFTGSATFSFLTNTRVPFAGVGGALTDNANLTYTGGQFRIADTTASTSTTTGALRVGGGAGIGENLYIAGNVAASGATHQFGASGLSAPIEYQIISASGYRRAIRYMTGSNGRWLLAANTESESGSDAGCSFSITAYNDAGSSIDSPISLTRASGGQITLGGTTNRQVYIPTTTASTSITTGALRVDGGVGVGGAFYLAGKFTCSSTADFGTTTATSTTNIRLYGAAGYYKLIQFHSGSSVRWYFGAGNNAESGSDSGTDFRLVACDDSGNNIDDPINAVRASGGKITLGNTSRPTSIAKTANNAEWIHGSISELLTLSTAGTTTDTTANLLPANSIIEAVVARVTTTITTATSWQLGDPTTAGRFTNANSTMTAGTTDIGLKHQQGSIATDAAGPVQTTAAKVRVTTVGTPGAGAIRITVFYRSFVAPQS